jgi:glutamate-1-semialdehyde 2,1-aminomutase
MDAITTGRVIHVGTFNGNPLCMAAARAVLDEICTPEETERVIARNQRFVADYQAALSRHAMPAHAVHCGAKGCITWSSTPVRNYRDYLGTNFDLAFAQWIWGVNRGLLLPPGLDEQWLISVMHDEADAMKYAAVFAEFVDELVA